MYHEGLTSGPCRLSVEESHHLCHVLRVSAGARVLLFDGAGREAQGTLVRRDRHGAVVEVDEIAERSFDLSMRLTLAVAPSKQRRQGYLIEKCTEIGVFAIWPLATERGSAHAGASAIERWRRRAIEACKQSRRAWVPRIENGQTIEQVLSRRDAFGACAICDVDPSGEPWGTFLLRQCDINDVLLLIGPEGGWTDRERALAHEAGLRGILLAPTTLRTETAAVAACAIAANYALRSNGFLDASSCRGFNDGAGTASSVGRAADS